MTKLDLAKKYKSYYTAKTKPELVDIAHAHFISIAGKGDPNERPFAEKIETLYPVAYAIKFACKERGQDFVVAKLEGLWWYDQEKFPGRTLSSSVEIPRSEWHYRLLIRMPDFVTVADFRAALQSVREKKNPIHLHEVERFELAEGTCIQMMHIGPFSTEPETLKQIAAFSDAHHLKQNGLHHEIYLSDFRKTKPDKLKTILREPVK